MHFRLTWDLSDIDLWNIDLSDTHLDLSDTDIPCQHFVCLQDLLKKSSKHAFKTSSRRVFNISSRRLQHKNFLSSKTPWRRLARCLQDVLEDEKLLRRRRVEDFLKTPWRRLGNQQMFTGKLHTVLFSDLSFLRCNKEFETSMICANWSSPKTGLET